jgi:hypothetical protein
MSGFQNNPLIFFVGDNMKDEFIITTDAAAIMLMERVNLPKFSMDAFKALLTKDKCLGIMVFAHAVGDTRIYNLYSNYYQILLEAETQDKQYEE